MWPFDLLDKHNFDSFEYFTFNCLDEINFVKYQIISITVNKQQISLYLQAN